ncbi:MAG TPA: hypothetical protein VD767_05845 [Thermomicrobiales bacterium]|nr:hypothetical protein [Thermomicrobiales bacterium]
MTNHSIEFIRLAGYPVRVTSLKRMDDSGDLVVVTITRGIRDPDLLREILAQPTIETELPGQESFLATVPDLDVRTSGEGATMITRFAMTLRPHDGPVAVAPPTLEERVATLEREVTELRATLERLTSP